MEEYCEWIDGYTERVHRKKQHASSIRTIPSKNIAFIPVLFLDSSSSMLNVVIVAYSRRTHSRKFRTQITLALFLTV